MRDRTKAPGARAALIATCVSAFLFQFDLTALSAALPDIAADLSARTADQVWIVNVYSLALIFALPLVGPIADRYGRRRMFLAGAALFALSSVFCALATNLAGLLIWRVLQGIAGAALTSSASALLAAAYPGAHRAWAFGIVGTVVGASMVAGPPAGALVAAFLGWTWVFWINVPICAALALLIGRAAFDAPAARSRAPLDWAGPSALALCVGSLAFALTAEFGGTSTFAAFAGSVAAFALFVRTERRHPAPAFDFALFAAPGFVAICLVAVASSIGFWALLVHLPQMARGAMGLGPAETGALLTALTVPMLALPSLGAKLATRLPARLFFTGGLAAIGAADLLLAIAACDLQAPGAVWTVAAALIAGGCGCALFNAQISAACVSAVPPDRAATAAAIGVTMRQVGFAFGIAALGAVIGPGDAVAYPLAFATAGGATLVLAGMVFGLLGLAKR